MISSNELLGRKAERPRAARVERAAASRRRCARPAGPARGGCAPRPCRRRSRRSAAICSATVQHDARHGQIDARPDLRRASSPAAWIRKPTAARGLACRVPHLPSTGSTASSPASGSRMIEEKKPDAALLGLPGRTHDGRQPDADAVDEAAARVVGEQQLADRLLRAVGGQRREMEIVRDRVRETARRTPRSRR